MDRETEIRLAELARLRGRTSMPVVGVNIMDAIMRFRGGHSDPNQLQLHAAALKAIREFGDSIEAIASRTEVAGVLRDLGQITFAEALMNLLTADAGAKALDDAVGAVRTEAEARQKAINDARHEDERRAAAQRAAKLQDQVDATSVEQVLRELAAAGTTVHATADGKLKIRPPQISVLHQRVLESKRADALRVLTARDATIEI